MFKNEKGFTLVEMLIVLMIITVLILLIIPNLADRSADVHDKGCDALVGLVQGQINAYQIDKGTTPSSLSALATEGYIEAEQQTCQNGTDLIYADGKVSN